jgi:hypothetical protein
MSLRRLALAAAIAVIALPALAQAQAGTCRDPWVTELVKEVTRRDPLGAGESGECNIKLYGASWSSKADLRAKVRQTFSAMENAGVRFEMQNGSVFKDVRMNVNIQSSSVYVGPRANAPQKTMYVDLPNGYAIAFNRPRCFANSNRGC